jgi:hypothetical protein
MSNLHVSYDHQVLLAEKDTTPTRMISKRTHALGFVIKVKELREPVDCALRCLVVGHSGNREMRCDRGVVDNRWVYGTLELGESDVEGVGRKMPFTFTS